MPGSSNRIAILSPIKRNPGAAHGGITPVVAKLARGFHARGLQVDLLGFAPESAYRELTGFPSELRWIDLGRGNKWLNAWRLWRYLQGESPDVLLACGWRANHVGAAIKNLPGVRTRIWGSVHNAVSPGLAKDGRYRRRRKIFAMRRTFGQLDGFIAVAQGTARDFAETVGVEPGSLQVIFNPILDADLLRSAGVPLEHPWFVPGQPPVILGVGRLTEQKDFPCLIRAFSLVQAKTSCRLVILGEGNERPSLEALVKELGISDCVRLPGFVANPFPFMRHAAVFALSSAWEGFGNVLVEALAVGTPVVSTDCPSGPREILADGRYGELVEVGDFRGLANALLSTLDRPLDPALLRRRAADFSVDRCVEHYLEVLGL